MAVPGQHADWAETKALFREAFRSSFHYSVASLGEDGAPHLTPVGSVLLTEPGRGIFFDIFTAQLGKNLDNDPRVCVMAVNSGKRFWLRSLARGRFARHPALRLYGTAGPRRDATSEEQARFRKRIRPARRLRGHDLLWRDLSHVRDLTFHTIVPVRVGAMTRHLK